MRFRKLRIAWSVFCGLACLLLIVLWVRSYSRLDYVEAAIDDTHYLNGESIRGKAILSVIHCPDAWASVSLRLVGIPINELTAPTFVKENGETNLSRLPSGWNVSSNVLNVV